MRSTPVAPVRGANGSTAKAESSDSPGGNKPATGQAEPPRVHATMAAANAATSSADHPTHQGRGVPARSGNGVNAPAMACGMGEAKTCEG